MTINEHRKKMFGVTSFMPPNAQVPPDYIYIYIYVNTCVYTHIESGNDMANNVKLLDPLRLAWSSKTLVKFLCLLQPSSYPLCKLHTIKVQRIGLIFEN